MPAWGKIMADGEIWQVVALLDHLETSRPRLAKSLTGQP